MYHCAQNGDRQHAPSKMEDEKVKNRDKEQMAAFQCSGWVHITLSDLSDIAFIKLDHCEDHIPYWPIDIPADVEKYVRDNTKMTPTQVCHTLTQYAMHQLIFETFLLAVDRNSQETPQAIFHT
jgi:hypothetical protein